MPAAPEAPIHILLIEDDDSIATPLAEGLMRAQFDVTVTRSGTEGLAAAAGSDLVLLDLGLPDLDGADVCRLLLERSDTPIIILTARGDERDRVRLLEMGADDYVVKPFAVGEVISRIRAVLRRARAVPTPRQLTVRDLQIDLGARRAWLAGAELELTRKEFDLLARLALDAGTVVSRETLMSEVWDENWFGSTKTLDVHISGLRRKLGEQPDAQGYIQTVRGVGFRLAAQDEPGP